eukprot:GHRR01015075.1.p1 GENE.GHRR01015075.1~~GHRR01015075.1.p1  ORF type:complete len:511 (+),score=177.65 GHRR01015075.1:499-2031(+)
MNASAGSEPQQLIVQDNLDQLLDVVPADLGAVLVNHPNREHLVEVVLDLGRRPEARFQGCTAEYIREQPITREELAVAAEAVGPFGSDNRAGIPSTLHRISALRSRRGDVVGLTCRVGRAVSGHVGMIEDILMANLPVLFLGRPGVGKTTVIREIARTLSDVLHKRVVIVDTSNEIGGDGDVPHPAIGGARRMQVADASKQHQIMIEAVENHMPEVVIVDEIGTEAEAAACRTIAERGVVLIGTAHGCFLENLLKNPTLSNLVGGVTTVTLGDEAARTRGSKKSVLERKGPPTFPVVIEMRDRGAWVAHDVAESVDKVLIDKVPKVQLRLRDPDRQVTCLEVAYDQVEAQMVAQLAHTSSSTDSSTDSSEGAAFAAAAATATAQRARAANLAGIEDLVSGVIGSSSSRAGGSSDWFNNSGSIRASSFDAAAFEGINADIDPWSWVERFKSLSETEALQELKVLKYLNGQNGVLRPRNHSGFGGGSPGDAIVAASSSKKKKRVTKASAKGH